MKDKLWQELSGTVAALAADSIQIQKRMNEVTAMQRARFVSLLAATPEPVRSLLLPLAPPSQTVKSHTVSCSVRMTTKHSGSVAILLSTINLGLGSLYETSTAEQSALTIEVKAVPIPLTKRPNI